MRKAPHLFVVISALLLFVLACSESDADTNAADAAAAEEVAPTTAMTYMADEEMADMEDGEAAQAEHGDFHFGEPAEAAETDQVFEIVASNDFMFTPASFTVNQGETITFRVTHEGAIAHDFTLGDAELQDAHDIEMAEMGGMMMEDEANGFMVEPGETKAHVALHGGR